MKNVQALTHTVTRTLDRVTKLQMKHLSLLPYRLIHQLTATDFTTATNKIQNNAHHSWTATNPHLIRPNNLRFPYAVTPRSNNRKSFFHQSTNEQTPTSTVMETIWFQEKDTRTLNNPHNNNYNPLLSYRNWS